ncbi:hypothetical protein TYRP_018374 [Tyrophagus putrescentiae]|nr:hypothetical protein TYRP_018374 [Tyrophagus putrescentiae]
MLFMAEFSWPGMPKAEPKADFCTTAWCWSWNGLMQSDIEMSEAALAAAAAAAAELPPTIECFRLRVWMPSFFMI